MPSLLEIALGFEGLALLRSWPSQDMDAVSARIDEVRSLVCEASRPLPPFVAPEHEVPSGYASWASTYDAPGNAIVDIEEPVVRGLLDRFPQGRVLDAACGTGRHAAYLHSRGHEVVALDVSPEMLDKLRGRTPDVEARQGDLRSLPLDSTSVDSAVCSLALTHLPELSRAISELARVVRPGGTVVISDIHPFAVLLGVQGFFTAADGSQGFVRNHVHLPGAYLGAFRSAGLQVLATAEPTFRAAHARLLLGTTLWSYPHLRQALGVAIDGMPAILVWELKRP